MTHPPGLAADFSARRAGWKRWAEIAFLCVAIAVFIVRMRGNPSGRFWDFANNSTVARAWFDGNDPYDERSINAAWMNTQPHAIRGLPKTIEWLSSVISPTALPLLFPFTFVPRGIGIYIWAVGSAAFFFVGALALARRVGVSSWVAFAGCVLLMGPLQSGVAAGQPAVLSAALMIFAVLAADRHRMTAAGVLAGIAAALKPQLAVPLIVYFAIDTHRRAAGIASLTFAFFGAIAVLRMKVAGVAWFGDWVHNMAASAANGSTNDYSQQNPTRDHLLNLQLPAYAIFHSRGIAMGVALGITAILAVIYVYLLRRNAPIGRRSNWIALATLAPLLLLPVYHRYYDAVVLVIPLACLMSPRIAIPRPWRWMIGLLFVPFIMPVGWATTLLNKHLLPASVATHGGWNIGVLPLQSWMALCLCIVFLKCLAVGEPMLDPQ